MQTHKDEKSLKYIEYLASSGLVTRFNRLAENLNHTREKSLEGFLLDSVTWIFRKKEFTHNVGLVI